MQALVKLNKAYLCRAYFTEVKRKEKKRKEKKRKEKGKNIQKIWINKFKKFELMNE